MNADQLSFNFATMLEDRLTELLSPRDIFHQATKDNVGRFLENRLVDRKDGRVSWTDLAKYYSMFSNTNPQGGVIFVGVADDGTPTGMKRLPQSKLNRIENFHLQSCPMATPEIRRIPYQDQTGEGDFFLAILLPYVGRLVETNKSEAYIRYGDSIHRMSPEEKLDFRTSRNEIQFELEPSPLSWPRDFDTSITRSLSDSFRQREDISGRTDEEILEIRRLGVIQQGKFFPNKALTLLAAKDARTVFPGCRVRIQRFEGVEEGQGENYNPLVDRFVEGNAVQLVERSASILDTIIYDFTYLAPDGKFVTTKEYPRTAWFEALVNAVCHRSYVFSGADISVKLFEDRLLIESPGGFCPPVTAENIYEVRASRNPFLMDAMYLLDYVKMAREGTRRMRESMRQFNLPEPTFAQEAVQGLIVKVELKNNSEYRKRAGATDVIAFVGAERWKALTEDQRKIVEIALRNGTINVSEAQRAIGKSWQTSKKQLIKLVTNGLFLHVHNSSDRDTKAHFMPNVELLGGR